MPPQKAFREPRLQRKRVIYKDNKQKGRANYLLAPALRSGQSPLVLGWYLPEFVALPLSVRALAMLT
jgi:hypothetical protein